jgi:hypothetical protein
MEETFSTRSMPRFYKQDHLALTVRSRVEAGSNISAVALQVVGGDEKGSLESETVP